MNFKISIIVPVYNTEKYLDKCLNSLANQTINEIEILVINDGSPDNSKIIIDHYVKKYPNKIKCYFTKNNGLGEARNYGIQFAKGEYIGFIDSDDYVKSYMFEEMYNKAIIDNADLVICEFDIVDESGKYLSTTSICGNSDFNNYEKKYAYKYGRTEAFNKLYKKDLFTKTNIRYPKGWFEDFPTTLLLIEHSNNISYICKPLMFYVKRKDSIMGNALKINFPLKNFDIFKMTQLLVINKNLFNESNYNFIFNEVVPIHIYTKFCIIIISITDLDLRNKILLLWHTKLNSIYPNWDKTTTVNNFIKNKKIFTKIFLKIVTYTFKTGNLFFLNSILRFGGSKILNKYLNKSKIIS